MATTLDKNDLKIIKLLQENGRISNLEISKEIGLSPAPTLERVKKLEVMKLIKGYHAQVDEIKAGIGIKAFIQVTLIRQRDNAIINFKKQIAKIDEVMEVYQVTGDTDYMMKVLTKDIASFERLIADKLSKIEEIGQMKTMIILSQIKDSKVLPIDYEMKTN